MQRASCLSLDALLLVLYLVMERGAWSLNETVKGVLGPSLPSFINLKGIQTAMS